MDCMIIAIVIYNILFSSEESSSQKYAGEEQEKHIKDILSDENLKRLQKEIMQAYEKNELLKFDEERESTPERTVTEGSKGRGDKGEFDRNSFYPISEIEGEKSVSYENNGSLRNDLGRRSTNRVRTEKRRGTKNEEVGERLDDSGRNRSGMDSEQTLLGLSMNRKFSGKNANHDTLKLSKQLLEEIQNSKIQEKDEENEEDGHSESVSMKDSMSKNNSEAAKQDDLKLHMSNS